jgi:hypothetical protein
LAINQLQYVFRNPLMVFPDVYRIAPPALLDAQIASRNRF